MRHRLVKGFTLIELLVVIGIIAILTVALIYSINPAEAQRKARDTQRLRDLSNLQMAIEEWLNDNPGASLNLIVSSTSGNRNCSTGWLGIDICYYMNVLPLDPRNSPSLVTNSTGGSLTAGVYYYVRGTGGVYNICTYLESKSNAQKLKDDGIDNNIFNIYSSTSITCP